MLTDVQVRKLKPKAKPYKAADRDGLYVLIQPTGAKWWRWDYRFAGKRKTLSLGVFDDVELAPAREKLAQLRKLLAAGMDPSVARKDVKRRLTAETRGTFEAVAREWLDKHRAKLAPVRDRRKDHLVIRGVSVPADRDATDRVD